MPLQHPLGERNEWGRRLLGDRLRTLRQEHELYLPELAERTGLSVSHLSDCERGDRALSLPALVAIADAYGLLVVDLLDGVYPYGAERPPRH